MSFSLTAFFRAHPIVASVIYGVGSAIVVSLTPYASSDVLVGAAIFVVNLIDSHITLPGGSPSPSATSPSAPAVTISGAKVATTQNVASLTSANGQTTTNVPLGSQVTGPDSNGWYYVFSSSGVFLAQTKINPFSS